MLPNGAIRRTGQGWLSDGGFFEAIRVPNYTAQEFFDHAREFYQLKQSLDQFSSDSDQLREEFEEAAEDEGDDDDPPPDPETIFASISFPGSGSFAAPSQITFSGADSYGSGEIVSYEWDFGDGDTASGETASHTFYEPGTHEVELTVTDEEGNEDQTTRQVQITAPSFTDEPLTLKSFRFEGEEDSDVTSYTWDLGDGTSATGRVVEHAYQNKGIYEVELTLSFTGGGTATVAREVYAGPRPIYLGDVTVQNDRTLSAAYGPYVVTDFLQIWEGATLTVEPGAVVKFVLETDLTDAQIDVDGTLKAEGTAQDSVVFTSIKDDAYGGDTNGDGSETSPSAGDWEQIRLDNTASGTVDHAVIRYGGRRVATDGGEISEPMVEVEPDEPGAVQVSNSRITGSYAEGIEARNGGRLLVENSRFAGNQVGLSVDDAGGSVQTTVFQNNNIGISISEPQMFNLGTPSAYGLNVIRNNETYDVKITSPDTIQAVGNYWGTTTASVIDANIYDDNEDSGSGPVLFEPFLGAPPEDGNTPPIASPDSFSVSSDSTLLVEAPGVLENDSDPDGDSLSASLVSGVSEGSLTLDADGALEYVPTDGFGETDSFTYEAIDDSSAADTASVTIEVEAVNSPPAAQADSFSVQEGQVLNISTPGVLENDTDPDGDSLAASVVESPISGDLSLNADGSLTYAPDMSFVGTDHFRYAASDGTLADTTEVAIEVESGILTRPIPLAEGWNLVSVPLAAEDPSFGAVLPLCESGFFFEPGSGYSDIAEGDSLAPGRGLFANCSAGTATVSGQAPDSSTVAVAQGWNIIGPLADSVHVDSITGTPPGLVQTSFFGFDPNGGYQGASTLSPGDGYWVKAGESGTLNLSGSGSGEAALASTAPAGPQAKNAQGAEKSREGVRLVFTDAEGRTATLRFLSNPSEAQLQRHALPPAPPGKTFDVRFAEGRSAAAADASTGGESPDRDAGAVHAGRGAVERGLDGAEPAPSGRRCGRSGDASDGGGAVDDPLCGREVAGRAGIDPR